MTVSLSKPSYFRPGTVVRVKEGCGTESGIVGFIRRTRPTNGDDVLVGIISSPEPTWLRASSLSYTLSSLEVVPK